MKPYQPDLGSRVYPLKISYQSIAYYLGRRIRIVQTSVALRTNYLRVKQMMMWRSEERTTWLSYKQEVGHGSQSSGGPRHKLNMRRIRKEKVRGG